MDIQYLLLQKYNQNICKLILDSEEYNEIKSLNITVFYDAYKNSCPVLIYSDKTYKNEYNTIVQYMIEYIENNINILNKDTMVESIFIEILKKYFNYKGD